MARNVYDVNVLEDPKEFGRRIGAARGYLPHPNDKKSNFAKLLGTSVPTLTRMEDGALGSVGATVAERRQLAERIVDLDDGPPPDIFGLSAPEPSAVDQLRQELREDLKAAVLQVTKERVEALAPLEDRLSRLEAGESGRG